MQSLRAAGYRVMSSLVRANLHNSLANAAVKSLDSHCVNGISVANVAKMQSSRHALLENACGECPQSEEMPVEEGAQMECSLSSLTAAGEASTPFRLTPPSVLSISS